MIKILSAAAVGAGVATILLGLAGAEARDSLQSTRPDARVAAAAPASTDAKAQAGQATAETIVQTPACGRKVKVVYAGYGEGVRPGCPNPAN